MKRIILFSVLFLLSACAGKKVAENMPKEKILVPLELLEGLNLYPDGKFPVITAYTTYFENNQIKVRIRLEDYESPVFGLLFNGTKLIENISLRIEERFYVKEGANRILEIENIKENIFVISVKASYLPQGIIYLNFGAYSPGDDYPRQTILNIVKERGVVRFWVKGDIFEMTAPIKKES